MKIRKPIFAFILLLILSVIMATCIVLFNFLKTQSDDEYRNDLVAQNAVDSLKILEKEMNRLVDAMNEKIVSSVELSVSVLRTLSEDSFISGPQVFDVGVVVQLKDEEILYPEDYPWRFDNLDAETLRNNPTLLFLSLMNVDGTEDDYVGLTGRLIRDDYYLIEWIPEKEYSEIMSEQISIFNVIEDLYSAFGGYLFLIDSKSEDLSVYYAPKEFEDVKNVEEIGLTKEMFENQVSIVHLGQDGYSANYMPLRMFGRQYTALILINSTNELVNIIINCGTVLVLVLITITAAILWLYWVQTHVRDYELTENQKKDYHPAMIRRKTRSLAVIGMIFFFVVAGALDALSNLSMEAEKNNKKLNLMESRMAANASMNSSYRSNEESSTVYFAQRLAAMLGNYPELQPRTLLMEANKLLGSEYILLFDEKGREIAGSNSYVSLSITDVTGPEGGFKKLLQGIPQLILEPKADLLEGKVVQLIGTPVFSPDEGIAGAVVIAIDPEKSWRAAEKTDYASFLRVITPKGNIAVIADNETGKILYTTEESLENETTIDVGLYGKDAKDTELDSTYLRVNGYNQNYYGAYQKNEKLQFYYLTFADVFQDNALPIALVSAFGFLLIYWAVTAFMLWPYRPEVYNETVRVKNSGIQDSLMDGTGIDEWEKRRSEDEIPEGLREHWKKLSPERKAWIFFQVALAVVLLAAGIRLLGGHAELTRSSIRFIMRGTWRRGFNLLSFAGMMVLIVSYLILIFCKNLLQDLVNNILDRKAETIFRLVFSFIQYAALIALLFFAFDFLGVDTRTLLASVSVLSLALTLGARDLVADILAGIFIIFEDDFQVGDIIEVNGFSGIVQEIGVRSTRLIGIGDNVKIIGNQNVKNVLNMSKMNSWYSLDLNIPADQPLKEIEAMLQLELPAIGESIPEIISGPYYKGVMAIGLTHTLYIIAECKQSNYRKVQRELNHAILMLFDEHGFKVGGC